MLTSDTPAITKRSLAGSIAAILWGSVLVVLLVRAGLHPQRPTSLTTYLTGGAAWNAGQPLYTNWRGFVYPPVIGAFFGLFAHLPLTVAAILWRAITAGGLLLGMAALLRSGVFHRIPAAARGLVLIGLLPLSAGNLDNAQANPLIAGLMMLSVAAFEWEAWGLCAFAIALATTFKIYPVALALLLCLLRPRQLSWRFTAWLIAGALLPFAFQSSHYVTGQYHAWLQTRLADNRFTYPMKDAPLDLWYLLVRLGNLPVSQRAYTAMQVLGGGAIALMVSIQSRRGRPLRDILAALYLLVSVWMLLLGPATENQTYVVLAPAACLAAVQSLRQSSAPVRLLALTAFAVLLAAIARNSLLPHLKSPMDMALQPVGALVLLTAILMDMRTAGKTDTSESGTF
jgi:hypothetical protein